MPLEPPQQPLLEDFEHIHAKNSCQGSCDQRTYRLLKVKVHCEAQNGEDRLREMRKRTDTCKVCKHWETWGSKQVAKKALDIRDALENCMEDYFKHFVAVAEMQGWMKEGFEKLTSVEMWEAPTMK